MGRRSEQTCLQRCADGQKAHEKMFNIANYQINANQNCNVVSPYTSQNGHHQKSLHTNQKSLQTINGGNGVEKVSPHNTVGGNVNWHNHYGDQYGGSLRN